MTSITSYIVNYFMNNENNSNNKSYCYDCFWCLEPTTFIEKDYAPYNSWDRECKNHGIKIRFMIDSDSISYQPFHGINIYVTKHLAIHYQIANNEVSLWAVSIKNIEKNIPPSWNEIAKLPAEFILRDIPSIISKANNLKAFT